VNPTDYLFLIGSWVLACCWVVAHGLTLNGLGPAAFLIMGGTWSFWMQWLRHRSWLRHRDSGFAPGTLHLDLLGGIGLLLGFSCACIWAFLIARAR
jgi:methylaspartate ammonia-lyase